MRCGTGNCVTLCAFFTLSYAATRAIMTAHYCTKVVDFYVNNVVTYCTRITKSPQQKTTCLSEIMFNLNLYCLKAVLRRQAVRHTMQQRIETDEVTNIDITVLILCRNTIADKEQIKLQ